MFAVGSNVQFEGLLTLRTGDQDVYFRQPFNFRGFDIHDLPGQRRVVPEPLMQKRVDCFFGRNIRGDRSFGRGMRRGSLLLRGSQRLQEEKDKKTFQYTMHCVPFSFDTSGGDVASDVSTVVKCLTWRRLENGGHNQTPWLKS